MTSAAPSSPQWEVRRPPPSGQQRGGPLLPAHAAARGSSASEVCRHVLHEFITAGKHSALAILNDTAVRPVYAATARGHCEWQRDRGIATACIDCMHRFHVMRRSADAHFEEQAREARMCVLDQNKKNDDQMSRRRRDAVRQLERLDDSLRGNCEAGSDQPLTQRIMGASYADDGDGGPREDDTGYRARVAQLELLNRSIQDARRDGDVPLYTSLCRSRCDLIADMPHSSSAQASSGRRLSRGDLQAAIAAEAAVHGVDVAADRLRAAVDEIAKRRQRRAAAAQADHLQRGRDATMDDADRLLRGIHAEHARRVRLLGHEQQPRTGPPTASTWVDDLRRGTASV